MEFPESLTNHIQKKVPRKQNQNGPLHQTTQLKRPETRHWGAYQVNLHLHREAVSAAIIEILCAFDYYSVDRY